VTGVMNCTVEGRVGTTLGHAQFVRSHFDGPIDRSGTPDTYLVELSLLPLSAAARAGFPDQWGPHRYERIGEICLYPAYRPVRAKSECRVQNSVMCGFLPDAVQHWLGDNIEWTDVRLERGLNIVNADIRGLLLRLGQELRWPGFASSAIVELTMGQLAVEIARHMMTIGRDRPAGGLAAWRLRLIDERLADVADCPSVGELAALCGLSMRQLARSYVASRGCSLGTTIATTRVDHAKRLLAADIPVKSVAHAVGFATASHFSVAFRRATGDTPRDYRARHCRNGDAGRMRAIRQL